MRNPKRAHIGRVKRCIDGVLLTSRSGVSFVCVPCETDEEITGIKQALAEILEEAEMTGYRRGLRKAKGGDEG